MNRANIMGNRVNLKKSKICGVDCFIFDEPISNSESDGAYVSFFAKFPCALSADKISEISKSFRKQYNIGEK